MKPATVTKANDSKEPREGLTPPSLPTPVQSGLHPRNSHSTTHEHNVKSGLALDINKLTPNSRSSIGRSEDEASSVKSGQSKQTHKSPRKVAPTHTQSTQAPHAKGKVATQTQHEPKVNSPHNSEDKGNKDHKPLIPLISVTTDGATTSQVHDTATTTSKSHGEGASSGRSKKRVNRISLKPLRSGVGETSLVAPSHGRDTPLGRLIGPSINPVRNSVVQAGNTKTEDFIVHYFREKDSRKTIDSRHEEFYRTHGFPRKPKYYPKSRRFSDTSETDPDFDEKLFDTLREQLNARPSVGASEHGSSQGSLEHVNRTRKSRRGYRNRVHPERSSMDRGPDMDGCNEGMCWKNIKECLNFVFCCKAPEKEPSPTPSRSQKGKKSADSSSMYSQRTTESTTGATRIFKDLPPPPPPPPESQEKKMGHS